MRQQIRQDLLKGLTTKEIKGKDKAEDFRQELILFHTSLRARGTLQEIKSLGWYDNQCVISNEVHLDCTGNVIPTVEHLEQLCNKDIERQVATKI